MFKLNVLFVPLALGIAASTACGLRATPEERIEKALDDVDANKAQRATVHAAANDLIGKLEVAKADRAVAKGRIIEQLKSDNPDAAVLHKEAAVMTASLAVIAHGFVDDAARIHDALDKGQREKLAENAKPGLPARGAMFMAGRMGYTPDAATIKEHVQKHVDETLARVDATPAQQKELEQLALGLADQVAPLIDDKDTVKDAFVAAWKSDKVDVKSLHALVDKELAKVNALADDAASRALVAHQVLTKEQRAKLIGAAI